MRGRDLDADERRAAEDAFLATPQPCFRASPLPTTHGWGVHCDHEGRIALVGVDTAEYRRLANDPTLTQLAAMRSKRA